MTDTIAAAEAKSHVWERPFFLPIMGLVLVVLLLFGDEFYGCVTGEGCWVGWLTIIGIAIAVVSFIAFKRADPEGNRSWAAVLLIVGLVIAMLGGSVGPSVKVLPSTQPTKISADIDRSAAKVDIIVRLGFEPDQFHRETISEFGVFSGTVRGDRSKLRLVAVPQENLISIANLYWVQEITVFTR